MADGIPVPGTQFNVNVETGEIPFGITSQFNVEGPL